MSGLKQCAFCRHWMLGTLDMNIRAGMLNENKLCTCHLKQPNETYSWNSCKQFDAIIAVKVA